MTDTTAGGTKTAPRLSHRAVPAAGPARPPGRLARPTRVGVVLGVVLGTAALAGAGLAALRAAPARHTLVVASLPYWNLRHGTAAVLAHRGAVTEVSPWIYGLSPAGQPVPQYPPGQAAAVTADLARLRAAGLRVVPSLADVTGGRWSYPPVARMLHSPRLMARQVAAITALVQRGGYAGIDIDYESLHAADRAAFTAFVARLAAALHARGKVVSVAVFARTSGAATAPFSAAQDYAAIGRSADQVRVMAYDYHWASSPPGPVAPAGWVRQVLRYARTQIPPARIVLGVPLYGYDWAGGHGTGLSPLRAWQLARRHHVVPRYDAASQEATFGYTGADGRRHTVWFEDAASSRARFQAAREAGIAGVFLWMYGYEDTATWAALGSVLPVSGPRALASATAVP